MTMFDRYTSNEWISPIIEEARPMLEKFPSGVAREVASAVLKTVDGGQTETPWATVFPSDDKSVVATRLVEVLRAPDHSTPAYDPDTRSAVKELVHFLDTHEAYGLFGCQAAYFLVQAAAGKESETFLTYQDLSRRWPQYSTAWTEDLTKQFGEEGYDEIMASDQELPTLMGGVELAAKIYYQRNGRLDQAGESTADLIARAVDLFDISTVDGLKEANRILERGFEGYREVTYRIRGLPRPTD